MRHALATIGIVVLLGLAGCSTSGQGAGTPGTTGTPPPPDNPITGPIDRASTVVDELNVKLSQEQREIGSMDPHRPVEPPQSRR